MAGIGTGLDRDLIHHANKQYPNTKSSSTMMTLVYQVKDDWEVK